jgi:lia operon protein LiaG
VLVTRGGAEAAKLKVVQDEVAGRPSLRVIYPSERIRYAVGKDDGSTQLRVREDGTFGDSQEWEHHHRRGRERSQEGRRVTIGSSGLDAHADLRVQVPAGRRVAIYLAVGKVTVSNVRGELVVDCASAPVTVTGFSGELKIDVGSGAVQATQIEGDLTVDTGSGSVEISRVKGTTLLVDTGSGDVHLTALRSPKVSLETGSGRVTVDLLEDVRELRVETGSGDIAITAPPTLGAEVEIETSSGDIETDFALQVTRHARDHLKGRIGDGNGTIAIETGSGEVKLLKSSN